jgi:2-polyprenyl-6-methoxyphenol hydroxylase-like FAD-dependent oxidoreductase
MMNNKPRFAIIGAGIGGLTLAVALQRKGIEVTVFEQAPHIKPLGAGLGLGANAVKAFTEIGIQQDVLKAGKVLKKLFIRDKKGRVLTETDSEQISRKFGAVDNFTIHRADLHDVLLKHIHSDSIRLDKRCIDFKQETDGILLRFQDRSTAYADHVIACDGIHSIFRTKLVPHSKHRYSGYTCWRGVIDKLPPNMNMEETSETWGNGSRFGIVPLAKDRVYWFACLNASENDLTKKNYTVNELLTHFNSFHEPVPSIIRNTADDQLIWGDIIDIKPMSRFAFSNIVLMGDAAHATTPNLGQGACMAIEDAVILSNLIDSHSNVQDVFVKFETLRRPRTEKNCKRFMDAWSHSAVRKSCSRLVEKYSGEAHATKRSRASDGVPL